MQKEYLNELKSKVALQYLNYVLNKYYGNCRTFLDDDTLYVSTTRWDYIVTITDTPMTFMLSNKHSKHSRRIKYSTLERFFKKYQCKDFQMGYMYVSAISPITEELDLTLFTTDNSFDYCDIGHTTCNQIDESGIKMEVIKGRRIINLNSIQLNGVFNTAQNREYLKNKEYGNLFDDIICLTQGFPSKPETADNITISEDNIKNVAILRLIFEEYHRNEYLCKQLG